MRRMQQQGCHHPRPRPVLEVLRDPLQLLRLCNSGMCMRHDSRCVNVFVPSLLP